MEKDLREYVRKERYNVLNGHFQKANSSSTCYSSHSPITEAEAQAYLGELLVHSRRKGKLTTYLEKALKLDPNLGMACFTWHGVLL
jgi:hypothetical protein